MLLLHARNEMKVMLHNSSILKQNPEGTPKKDMEAVKDLPSDWCVFEESHTIGAFSCLKTCTVVSPLTVCLFSGLSKCE